MSTFVVLEFQAKPDKVDAVKEFLRQVLPDTRNYAGYESLVLHQSQDDPTAMMMYERWSTRPQYDAYLAWRTDTGALAEFAEMLAGPPSFHSSTSSTPDDLACAIDGPQSIVVALGAAARAPSANAAHGSTCASGRQQHPVIAVPTVPSNAGSPKPIAAVHGHRPADLQRDETPPM